MGLSGSQTLVPCCGAGSRAGGGAHMVSVFGLFAVVTVFLLCGRLISIYLYLSIYNSDLCSGS